MELSYEDAVAYIHSRLAFGIQPGLSRISALLSQLGNPQAHLKFLHVAGTNGKGSTSTMLSEILKAAGYKTGLFTSPYVFSFCERIQINNQNIEKADLAACVEQVKAAIEVLEPQSIVPTEFETITAAAMLYFYEQHCDYVVLEVGLGGRFDSTNVIPKAEVCVLTSISLDHTKILGDTVEKIAWEKAGILKEGGVCVTTSLQNPQALAVLESVAGELHNTLHIADFSRVTIIEETLGKTAFTYRGEPYTLQLTGRHQIENAIGVIEAAACIDGVTQAHIKAGLAHTVMLGRMEMRQSPVLMLLDGGHNPECAEALAAVLKQFAPRHVTALIGMMADKDTKAYLDTVLAFCDRVVFTAPQNNPRAAAPADLAAQVESLPLEIEVQAQPKAALARAIEWTQADGLLLCCGSFYLLSDLFQS